MKSRIYIPTRGRPSVPTFWALPEELQRQTTLVIREDEEELYQCVPVDYVLLPKKVEGLSATRQWILENSGRYVMQLDDDFASFNIKPHMDDWKLMRASPRQIVDLFNLVDYWITEKVAHAGIMDRVRAATPSTRGQYQTRQLCAQFLAYDNRVLRKEQIRFDRVLLSQDKDVCLQLLELGYENRISRRYSYNCKAGDSPGGCALYRTEKLRREQSDLLANLHPEGIIRQRKKRMKTKGGRVFFRAKNHVNWRLAFGARITERRSKC